MRVLRVAWPNLPHSRAACTVWGRAARAVAQGTAAAMMAVSILAGPSLAQGAGSSDYQFDLVERELKQGYGAVLTVRLVHRATGKVVPGAVVFISRLDMSPDSMGEMTAPLEPVPDVLPGYFRFETDLVMEGDWSLVLMAKLPDADGYVRGKLIVTAVP
ncbi:FixH family protein [Microvirga arsenatis]|nr:FixH family protein [Microvirga arsenatis]